MASIAWRFVAFVWNDVRCDAGDWWRRNIVRQATPEEAICNDCREPHCTEERRLNCPTLKGTKPC